MLRLDPDFNFRDQHHLLPAIEFGDQISGQGGSDALRGGAGTDTLAGGSGGDRLVASEWGHGVVINFQDADNQFVAEITGALPTSLYYGGAFPTSSFGFGGGFSSMTVLKDALMETVFWPTDLSTYSASNRLDLKNAESAIGTQYDDLIVGADTVYTWETPPPDPNAPAGTPPPGPQRVVDKSFQGYDLIGGAGNDTIIVRAGNAEQVNWRLIDGGADNDVIVVRDFGNQFTVDPTTHELERSEIRGGAGDDIIFSIGSAVGGDIVGGAGTDLIFSTALAGNVWGDTKEAGDTEYRDIFWWAPGVFIQDADTQDMLQIVGVPLTGGSNSFFGFDGWAGEMAWDWLLPFMWYGASEGDQLFVYSALSALTAGFDRRDVGDDRLKSMMVVEHYRSADDLEQSGGAPAKSIFENGTGWYKTGRGDLNLSFRIIYNEDHATDRFFLDMVLGQLKARLSAVWSFAKMLSWLPPQDPLVLDLDGDGIEISSLVQTGAHFDLDGDHFAERTGWVEADDGNVIRLRARRDNLPMPAHPRLRRARRAADTAAIFSKPRPHLRAA